MKPKIGRPNPSQYNGTTKNTICNRCKKNLNSMDRDQQDKHEIECKKQKQFGEI